MHDQILYGRRADPDADTVIRYYTYVDMGLEFCNTALSAFAEGHVSRRVYEGHYRPLVRLFLTENYPQVRSALPGPYLSTFVRDELRAARDEGWDWALQHQRLCGEAAPV